MVMVARWSESASSGALRRAVRCGGCGNVCLTRLDCDFLAHFWGKGGRRRIYPFFRICPSRPTNIESMNYLSTGFLHDVPDLLVTRKTSKNIQLRARAPRRLWNWIQHSSCGLVGFMAQYLVEPPVTGGCCRRWLLSPPAIHTIDKDLKQKKKDK